MVRPVTLTIAPAGPPAPDRVSAFGSYLDRADPRALIAASGGVTAVWMTWWPSIHGTARLALVVVAIGAYAIALVAVGRRPPCGLGDPVGRFALVAVVLLLALAVWLEPRGSQDLWSYVMYGRTVAIHHVSPYTHPPAAFPHDPYFARVSRGWRHSDSVYGPAFTAYSTVAAALAGPSAVLARLGHQLLAAASVLAIGVGTAQRRGDVAPMLFLALNPAVIAIANGGHNDLLVGALIAAAVALAGRHRHASAGVVVGLAICAKAIAGLPALALVWWVWRRAGRRAGIVSGVAAAGVASLAYAVAGGAAAVTPVLAGAHFASRASLWSGPRRLLGPLPADGVPWGTVAMAATLLLALGLVAAVSRRRWLSAGTPASAVTGLLVTLVFTLPYVLPWYAAWALPTASLVHRSRAARFACWQSLALLVAYTYPPGAFSASALVGIVSRAGLPVCLLAVLATLAWRWPSSSGVAVPTGRAPAGAQVAAP